MIDRTSQGKLQTMSQHIRLSVRAQAFSPLKLNQKTNPCHSTAKSNLDVRQSPPLHQGLMSRIQLLGSVSSLVSTGLGSMVLHLSPMISDQSQCLRSSAFCLALCD